MCIRDRLNRQADEDLVEPQKVAENFLKKNNYFEDVEVDKKELQKYKEFVKGGKDV